MGVAVRGTGASGGAQIGLAATGMMELTANGQRPTTNDQRPTANDQLRKNGVRGAGAFRIR